MTTERAARYLAAPDAARYLGISKRTFFAFVRKNVPSVSIGARVLFDVADLDRWVQLNKRVPAGADVAADMAIGEEVAAPLPERTLPSRMARARLEEIRKKARPAEPSNQPTQTRRRAVSEHLKKLTEGKNK